MDGALRDLDMAIQRYQTETDPSPLTGGHHQPLNRQEQDSSSVASSAQDPWEELLLTRNSRVQAWQDYFLGPAWPRLLAAFDRLVPFRNHVVQILSQMGLPEDLIAVAFVESELTGNTVSPKGAFGAWQFMSATAARYGLKRNVLGDERTDFDKSTVAAARYLADLHRLFGDWALALAAYNAGEDRVLEAVAKGKTRDFWRLSEQGLLPEETRQYVPKVLGTARAWKAMLLGLGTDRAKPVLSASANDRQTWSYALRLEELGN
jgi:soluble lytic murein transglycosylase-like protein